MKKYEEMRSCWEFGEASECRRGLMLGMGGATKFTLLASQGKHQDANRMFTTAVQATVCAAVFFFLLGALGAPGLTRLLGGEGHVGQLTCTYLRVLLMFSPVFLFNDLMLCFVRNDGAPRRAMAATLTGCLMNIVLDYVFIFPLGMGMFGAVLATGCSPILGLIIQSGHWLGGKASFQLQKTTPRPAELGSIGALGFPSFLSEACSGVVMILFNTILLQVEGSIGVAAYGVVANLALVVTAMFTGIAQGTQPLLSQACGQRDAARAFSCGAPLQRRWSSRRWSSPAPCCLPTPLPWPSIVKAAPGFRHLPARGCTYIFSARPLWGCAFCCACFSRPPTAPARPTSLRFCGASFWWCRSPWCWPACSA